MRVMVLSPDASAIADVFAKAGDDIVVIAHPIEPYHQIRAGASFVVSFGYRHIIPYLTLAGFGGKSCNIHISMLPWNRGSDPNFWSWFDGTPKGVSLHVITPGIDRGPTWAQREIRIAAEDHTLRTSYDLLKAGAVNLFAEMWPVIRGYGCQPQQQAQGGSYHRMRDKTELMNLFPLGHETPCSQIEEAGTEMRTSGAFSDKVSSEVNRC